MNYKLHTLFVLLLLAGFGYSPTVQAMDETVTFEQLPDDVLLYIIKLVAAEEPDSLESLMRIQTVSKRLQGVLSDQQIKWIEELTQDRLDELLNTAIYSQDVPIIRLWFRFGAKMNKTGGSYVKSIFGITSHELQRIARGEYEEPQKYTEDNVLAVLKLLVAHGADIGQSGSSFGLFQRGTIPWSPLQEASERGWKKMVKYFLDLKIPVDNASLMFAVIWDHPEVVQLLLDYGANPNFSSALFVTPPLGAVKSAKVARVLLDAGAQLYVDCGQGPKVRFADMANAAIRSKDPSILIELLKKNYLPEAATAIALAILAGASIAGMSCTIL